MKNQRTITYFLLMSVSVFLTNFVTAQEDLDCPNMCVKDIAMNAEGGMVDITLRNGNTQINYPIIMIVLNGDTVANVGMSFFFFAQAPDQVMIHTVQTSLTTIPENFECQVLVRDNLTNQTCVVDYPCLAASIVSMEETGLELFPNPVSDVVNINFSHKIIATEIYNFSGQLVSEMNDHDITQLDCSGLVVGQYQIVLTTDDGTKIVRKLNKQ